MLQYALVAIGVGTLVLGVWAAITYVYRDAPRRGMDGDQWAGVLAVTAGVGFLLYLYRRPSLDEVDGEAGAGSD